MEFRFYVALRKNKAMDETIVDFAARVIVSYVSNNRISGHQLPELIQSVYKALSTVEATTAAAAVKPKPAVEVKKSILPGRIVCLVCGEGFSMLKRHLGTEHQLTPQEYRVRYELPRDYPLVAPNYAKTRSALAKKIGLGRKAGSARKAGRLAARKRG